MNCLKHTQIKLDIHGFCQACKNEAISNISPIKQEKQTFTSGATSSEQLPGYDMLPELFLTRTAKRFTLGAAKHGKFNYRKGLKDKEFIIDRLNHAFLHLKKAIDLIEANEMSEDDNLGAVAVNIAMAMEYESANGFDYMTTK